MKGELVWHFHADIDELFVVMHRILKILFRDGEVKVPAGGMLYRAEKHRA